MSVKKNRIRAIAGKLRSEGVTFENFSIELAVSVISLCVGSTALIPILKDNESDIKEMLREISVR